MFCTTECWDCEDKTCEHYIQKSKLYFKSKQQDREIERLKEEIKGYEQERERVLNIIDERNHKAIEHIDKELHNVNVQENIMLKNELLKIKNMLQGVAKK